MAKVCLRRFHRIKSSGIDEDHGLQENAEKEAAEAEQLRIIKHGDRNVEANEGGVKLALDTDSLLAEFKNLASYAGGPGGDGGDGGQGGGNGGWAIGQRPIVETEKLRKQMAPLELRACVGSLTFRLLSC